LDLPGEQQDVVGAYAEQRHRVHDDADAVDEVLAARRRADRGYSDSCDRSIAGLGFVRPLRLLPLEETTLANRALPTWAVDGSDAARDVTAIVVAR
jgi:hypothetical protein